MLGRWWRAKWMCLCGNVCVWMSVRLSAVYGWAVLRKILFTQAVAPMWHFSLRKAFWKSQCVKSAAKWANTHWQRLSAAPFSCRTRNDKTKPLRQMRCILARIHLSFEGVIFLIRGVSGALRQMKTLSKYNVLLDRNPTCTPKEKWTDVSLHKRLVLVFSTVFLWFISTDCHVH